MNIELTYQGNTSALTNLLYVMHVQGNRYVVWPFCGDDLPTQWKPFRAANHEYYKDCDADGIDEQGTTFDFPTDATIRVY